LLLLGESPVIDNKTAPPILTPTALNAQRALAFVISSLSDAKRTRTTVESIAGSLAAAQNLNMETALAIASASVGFFRLLGPLDLRDGEIVLHDQVSSYFLKSLLWFLRNESPLLDNWERNGAATDGTVSNILEAPPILLRAMEERRMLLSKERNLHPEPSRVQSVSANLIKRTIRGKPHFLHQWDADARQFQLIGGKNRSHESPLMTARREASEELAGDLSNDKHFEVTSISDAPLSIARYPGLTVRLRSTTQTCFS
jgi:hypothetical protein